MSVYFIQAGDMGPVKIGFAADSVKTRLRDLQCGNHLTLQLLAVIPGTLKTEKRLHHIFCQHRFRGEWYYYREPIVGLIEQYVANDPDEATALVWAEEAKYACDLAMAEYKLMKGIFCDVVDILMGRIGENTFPRLNDRIADTEEVQAAMRDMADRHEGRAA